MTCRGLCGHSPYSVLVKRLNSGCRILKISTKLLSKFVVLNGLCCVFVGLGECEGEDFVNGGCRPTIIQRNSFGIEQLNSLVVSVANSSIDNLEPHRALSHNLQTML